MDIRQLQYLVALAQEKHFTRAAQACHVTQSTLSGRIRQLEQELGVPIVERSQRFQGFTAEGERVLKWAHAILDHHPGVELTVLSQSSIEILRNLEDFSIDVGLTYLDNEPIEGVRSEAIYMERYCLLVRRGHPLADATEVTWVDAAKEPLCLL